MRVSHEQRHHNKQRFTGRKIGIYWSGTTVRLRVSCELGHLRVPVMKDDMVTSNPALLSSSLPHIKLNILGRPEKASDNPCWPARRAGHMACHMVSLGRGDLVVVLSEDGLLVADVSVVHPAAESFIWQPAQQAGTAASAQDTAECQKYGSGQVAGGSFMPPSTESCARMGRPAMQFLGTLANTASTAVASDVTTSFLVGALRELSIALVKGNEVIYAEPRHVTAGSMGARAAVDPE
jgi:hypothetical protein